LAGGKLMMHAGKLILESPSPHLNLSGIILPKNTTKINQIIVSFLNT